MRFGRTILGNYKEGTKREYLLTNGKGGFSSGCINGNLGRRFHGLMVSSFLPPLDRYMVLHKVEEKINSISLNSAHYFDMGDKFENGHIHLESFEINPFPTFIYSINGNILKKEIIMIHQEDTILLKYTLLHGEKEENSLELDFFANYRDWGGVSEKALSYKSDKLE